MTQSLWNVYLCGKQYIIECIKSVSRSRNQWQEDLSSPFVFWQQSFVRLPIVITLFPVVFNYTLVEWPHCERVLKSEFPIFKPVSLCVHWIIIVIIKSMEMCEHHLEILDSTGIYGSVCPSGLLYRQKYLQQTKLHIFTGIYSAIYLFTFVSMQSN